MDERVDHAADGDGGCAPAPVSATARLCVLGSGSRGNCSVLVLESPPGPDGGPGKRCVCLIDLGLSPKVTAAMLEAAGLSLGEVETVLLTHLDHDHSHDGWCDLDVLPRSTEVFVYGGHLERAYRRGLNGGSVLHFEAAFTTRTGLVVKPLMVFHDILGAAVFRVELPNGGQLGYATDLGRVTDEMVAHLRGVDVLAIESNYCPQMQMDSARPAFLKRRIMGGRGHLANDEALEAIGQILPREHVVLLHLSAHCNRPELVATLHEGADYALTISTQHEPTRWVPIRRSTRVVVQRGQLSLWGGQ